jgi:acetyl-CoA synthetase
MAASSCWYPDDSVIASARLGSMMRRLAVADFDALYDVSIGDAASYWSAVADDLGWHWRTPWREFRRDPRGAPFAEFFVGAELNWVDNVLAQARSNLRRDSIAIVGENEEGEIREVTYGALTRMTMRAAGGLRACGIGVGDRVGLMLPQGIEAAVALMALSVLGAIVVPLFSGFGADAVSDRLVACDAKGLIVAGAFSRRGRKMDTADLVAACRSRVPTLDTVVVVDNGGDQTRQEACAWGSLFDAEPVDAPVSVAANHPFMVLFTSGTTGKPKGTVHTHAGFPLKVMHDAAYLFDLREGERWFWPSDMGWVVGPLTTIAALSLGATLVCYDGAPDVPDWRRIPDLLARHAVTHFGASPTLIRAMAAASVRPVDAASLRILISAGEVFDAEHFDWFFRTFGHGRLPIINYTGGTEASGALLSNVVLRPITPSGFNAVSPGIEAAVIDEKGEQIAGQVGELALRGPFIGMTHSFWRDDERYLESYWRQHAGLWTHGDLAIHDHDGQMYLLGRSDDTLKIAGKRLGPAEVEAAVLDRGVAVKEVAAVGVPDPVKGQQLVLCVVPLAGYAIDTLANDIADHVANALGKAFRPQHVLFVDALPRTRNAKVMRRVIRQILGGLPPGDLSSLENPDAVAALHALRERIAASR